jgi:hypothetical protein
VTVAAAEQHKELQNELREELKYRVLGIPLALIAARIGVSLFPFLTGFLRRHHPREEALLGRIELKER